MTNEQLQMYNDLTTLQQNVAICRINMPLSSDAEVYKLGGGTAVRGAGYIPDLKDMRKNTSQHADRIQELQDQID